MNILIEEFTGHFAENKDVAKDLRTTKIEPAFKKNENIVLDFKNIDSTTQSFVHALISEIFQKNGEDALEYIEFKNCNKPVKSLVTTVINYSME